MNSRSSGLRPILLAEDNPNDVELTLAALQSARLENEVVVVHDGGQALAWLRCTGDYAYRSPVPPAFILLDLKMPRVDGLATLRAIRADPQLRSTPVVILTSSREENDLVTSYHLGANAYVVKPVEFDSFITAVSQLGVFWAELNEPAPVRQLTF
jgi:CheY-like chemotaxis protein